MKLFNKIFKTNNGLTLRFSKSTNEWQVYLDSKLLYIGEKTTCEKYILNQQVAQEHLVM